jgi:hypothetical protein
MQEEFEDDENVSDGRTEQNKGTGIKIIYIHQFVACLPKWILFFFLCGNFVCTSLIHLRTFTLTSIGHFEMAEWCSHWYYCIIIETNLLECVIFQYPHEDEILCNSWYYMHDVANGYYRNYPLLVEPKSK